MLILGLLLLATAGAFTCLVITGSLVGGPDYEVSMLSHHMITLNTLAVFCAGLAVALMFCLGLYTATSAATHHRRGTFSSRTPGADESVEPHARP
ncbi:hypothetical protein [Streptomyces sp. NPDC057403]|uniref:hypothetical protein n=1 Tax=Streptomyces sp. NPDC057403 TaxID=3346119 RepID=UPI0036C5314B